MNQHHSELCGRLQSVVHEINTFLYKIIPVKEQSKISTSQFLSDYDKVGVILTVIIDSNNREHFDKFCECLCKVKHQRLTEELQSQLCNFCCLSTVLDHVNEFFIHIIWICMLEV